MIYLDSSAILKLVRAEAESAALGDWLAGRSKTWVLTSELGRVEVLRAARRVGEAVVAEAHTVIGDIDLIPLDRRVQDLACEFGTPMLRTLDALHLASALLVREELTDFVAYDRRLSAVAEAAGLPVATPGG